MSDRPLFERLVDIWQRLGSEPTLEEQYERIARKIDPSDLQRSSSGEWELSEEELLDELTTGEPHTDRISGYYTKEGLEFALERYGLFDKLRKLGFGDLRLEFDTENPKRQHITCFGSQSGREFLLMDLMMGRIRQLAPEGVEPPNDLELLSIEWMMLQNPAGSFAPDHPRWPGQEHPGLGLNEEVLLLHILGARRLGLDGVVSHPSRYHIACLGRDRIWFLDPTVQGRFDALRETLAGLDLSDATWKMERGEVRWVDDGSPVEWLPKEYIVPTSPRLAAYFRSSGYQEPRTASFERARARGIEAVGENREGEQ